MGGKGEVRWVFDSSAWFYGAKIKKKEKSVREVKVRCLVPRSPHQKSRKTMKTQHWLGWKRVCKSPPFHNQELPGIIAVFLHKPFEFHRSVWNWSQGRCSCTLRSMVLVLWCEWLLIYRLRSRWLCSQDTQTVIFPDACNDHSFEKGKWELLLFLLLRHVGFREPKGWDEDIPSCSSKDWLGENGWKIKEKKL